MSSSDLIRWGGLAAITGSVVWIVDGLLNLAVSESAVADVLFIIAALCTVGGFVGFHTLQEGQLRADRARWLLDGCRGDTGPSSRTDS